MIEREKIKRLSNDDPIGELVPSLLSEQNVNDRCVRT